MSVQMKDKGMWWSVEAADLVQVQAVRVKALPRWTSSSFGVNTSPSSGCSHLREPHCRFLQQCGVLLLGSAQRSARALIRHAGEDLLHVAKESRISFHYCLELNADLIDGWRQLELVSSNVRYETASELAKCVFEVLIISLLHSTRNTHPSLSQPTI